VRGKRRHREGKKKEPGEKHSRKRTRQGGEKERERGRRENRRGTERKRENKGRRRKQRVGNLLKRMKETERQGNKVTEEEGSKNENHNWSSFPPLPQRRH
jgi:hypothetical protein